jgi:hypothetical protein
MQVNTLFAITALLFLCLSPSVVQARRLGEPQVPVAEHPKVASSGCTVITQDGSDRTSEWVKQQRDGTFRVECNDETQCQRATIIGCDVVYCEGVEACVETLILDTRVRIQCDGFHACHRTKMLWTAGTSNDESASISSRVPDRVFVNCIGEAVCDAAAIHTSPDSSVSMDVTCQNRRYQLAPGANQIQINQSRGR